MDSGPETSAKEVPARCIVLECEPRLNQKFSEQRATPPKLTLSGLVPGRLTNRRALRTRTPRREEVRQVGDVDDPIEIGSAEDFVSIKPPHDLFGGVFAPYGMIVFLKKSGHSQISYESDSLWVVSDRENPMPDRLM